MAACTQTSIAGGRFRATTGEKPITSAAPGRGPAATLGHQGKRGRKAVRPGLAAGGAAQLVHPVGPLPGEIGLLSAEVAEGRRLGVDRPQQVQGLDDGRRAQVAYAIGKAKPVGLFVECFGTEKVPVEQIQDAVMQVFDLRPRAIIYAPTAAFGHFGREEPDFSWERTDRTKALRSAAGL